MFLLELVLFKGNQEFNIRIWQARKMPLPSVNVCTYVRCAALGVGHTKASKGHPQWNQDTRGDRSRVMERTHVQHSGLAGRKKSW